MKNTRNQWAWLYGVAIVALALLAACSKQTDTGAATSVTVSVIGTNDVHGQILPVDGHRGLALFAGYMNNLRALRESDGGAVLLIDAGDMWQGTLESNLSEGASVVEAFNALGYAAAAIGNHEFDFGPAGPKAIPVDDSDDAQGALKQRAAEAQFPFLAANLINLDTEQPVSWPNVQPSVLVDAAGVKIGIIGVMSANALSATIAANVRRLRVAPLAPAIEKEARALRKQGAQLVIVTAHAGSRCNEFNDPLDLSSCDIDGEIMQVARELPAGLVDQIIGGHVHLGIAHEVNGVAITSSFSNTRAFGRVDYVIDMPGGSVASRQIHAPQFICSYVGAGPGQCLAADDDNAKPDHYAGSDVVAGSIVSAIADAAAARAEAVRSEPLGVFLETPVTQAGGTASALGHLFVDAILESTDGDIVVHNVVGGIRDYLPQGDLTYGSVYRISPFDNRIITLNLTGAELRTVLANEVRRSPVVAFSGMRAYVSCSDGELEVAMQRADGTTIDDDDAVEVVTTDFLALGGGDVFAAVTPDGGFDIPTDTPMIRELFVEWLKNRGGRLRAEQFVDAERPRWNLPDSMPADCSL